MQNGKSNLDFMTSWIHNVIIYFILRAKILYNSEFIMNYRSIKLQISGIIFLSIIDKMKYFLKI